MNGNQEPALTAEDLEWYIAEINRLTEESKTQVAQKERDRLRRERRVKHGNRRRRKQTRRLRAKNRRK